MKPLALAVLSVLAFSFAPVHAQSTSDADKNLDALKKKYAGGGQKPDTTKAGASDPASKPAAQGDGPSIAELEQILLRSPECKKNAADTSDLAAGLKGKYGLISCSSQIDGLSEIVLVPASVAPNRQLMYQGVVGYKLVGARFFDHYLVLQFDKQTQYLDLLKQEKDAAGKDQGFALSGFVTDRNASKFGDSAAFVDALKHYMGITDGSADSVSFSAIPARVAKTVGGQPFHLNGAFTKGALVVTVTAAGDVSMIWPDVKRP